MVGFIYLKGCKKYLFIFIFVAKNNYMRLISSTLIILFTSSLLFAQQFKKNVTSNSIPLEQLGVQRKNYIRKQYPLVLKMIMILHIILKEESMS